MSDTVTAVQRSLGWLLKPLSWIYGGCMRLREQLYKHGLFHAWEPEVLTVSVGNIGWGGSGKTPVAGWLLDWAATKGLKALLLTRGYKARPVSYPYHVRPGALVEEAGDEPLMLASQHPEAHIIVDPIRSRAGRWGIRQFNPRLIVLDDGFQHMAVKRHINLVLLRPDDLDEQWNRVIPAGSWREPEAALKRADAFMIKVGPKNFKRLTPRMEHLLGKYRKPVFSFQVLPTGVRHVRSGNTQRDFEDGKYLLVTGVGDPGLVAQTARMHFGYSPSKHLIFRDHHAYTKNDVLTMQATARRMGCDFILCTPKDAVKLGPMCSDEFWQFDLRMAFGPSSIGKKTTFSAWWKRRYEAIHLYGFDAVPDPADEIESDDG